MCPVRLTPITCFAMLHGMNTTTSTEGSIDAHVEGHVLRIVINRPSKMNGFTPVMYEGMARAYTQLEDDPNLNRPGNCGGWLV